MRKRDLILENVAYVPGFHTNIISGYLMWKELKIWHCPHTNELVKENPTKREKITLLMSVKSMYRQLVIKYKPLQLYSFPSIKPLKIPQSDDVVFVLPVIQTAPRQPHQWRKKPPASTPDGSLR